MLDFYIDRINEKLKEMHKHHTYETMGKMLVHLLLQCCSANQWHTPNQKPLTGFVVKGISGLQNLP